ncbi:MAG: hypothetical protein QM669_01920 [Siphonobacter sp.]
MKMLLLSTIGFLFSLTTFAQYGYYAPSTPRSVYQQPSIRVQYNNGYTRQNGIVVDPYYSTKRDDTNWNNFSTQGNVNPYTNEVGRKAKDYSDEAYNYGQGRTIYEGPRGGQYYINDRGNKVYVPKREL